MPLYNEFLQSLLPGNYALTKSMELTKVQDSGTLWYTKKFLTLYYYVFLSNDIMTTAYQRAVIEIFDNYIQSLPEEVKELAEAYFYPDNDSINFKSQNFNLFSNFASYNRFATQDERSSYYQSAKKYYFSFLMGSGGQKGVKKMLKEAVQQPGFVYSHENIDEIILWAAVDVCMREANADKEISDNSVKYILSQETMDRACQMAAIHAVDEADIRQLHSDFPHNRPNYRGTEDDGNAKITNHILLDDAGVISRLLSMSDCGTDYMLFQDEATLANLESCNMISVIPGFKELNGKVIFRSSENMADITDETVKLVVTSPPYWNLKDYFKKGQIGQESYKIYLSRMKSVWTQCYNKLTEDGSLWININIRVQSGKVIPIPHDFVNICRELGFFYKGIIIWHKSSGIPTGDNNIVDRHEYVLIFSKKEQFFVNQAVFSKFSDYKNDLMNGGAFWNINRKAGSVGKKYVHPAIYPNELVKRIVLLTTTEGDLVVDPFLGSGTSLISALEINRNFIGYEYNEGFKELMQSRFDKELENKVIEYLEHRN